jgi:CRP-like cAMP-binding protein
MSTLPTPGKLSPELLQALRGIQSVRTFPQGAKLFEQGSAVAGVYVVESGEVRILLPTVTSKSSCWRLLAQEPCLG